MHEADAITKFVQRQAVHWRGVLRLAAPLREPVPIVVSSPHSGRRLPAELRLSSALRPHELRRIEDRFVDLLCAAAPGHGMALLTAVWTRGWIDLNRSPMTLDPALLREPPPDYLMDERDERLMAGLGVIPRLADGRIIHRRRIDRNAACERIVRHHLPWHRLLARLLARLREAHGSALLLDCHSMPEFPSGNVGFNAQMPDIVLGDRHGASADGHLVQRIGDHFSARGYRVGWNRPFAGGFTTERHGKPANGLHAIQIEIARRLYMDEKSGQPHLGLERVRRDLAELFAKLAILARENRLFRAGPGSDATGDRRPLAAE